MQKSTVAVCLAMVMLSMAIIGAAAPSDAAGGEEFEGYELDLTSAANYSHQWIGGLVYNAMTEARPGQYENKINFSCDQLIIHMDTVPEDAFARAETTEVVITERVKTIERGAFRNIDELHTVSTYGSPSTVIKAGAFTGCDNLRVIDLRSHGTIEEGAFDSDYSGAVVIDDPSDIPSWMSYGRIIDVSDIERGDVFHVRHSPDDGRLSMQYVGHGRLMNSDTSGSGRVPTVSVETYGNMLSFSYTSSMDIDYLAVTVTYEGFGLGSATLEASDGEIELAVPDGYTFGGGFRGWETTTGKTVGTSLDMDEIDELGTSVTLRPIIASYTITFDMGALPAGETASLEPVTSTGTGTYPELLSEHYRVRAWSVDGREFAPGSEVTELASHTAVALWEVRPECHYDVRYLNADGSATGVSENLAYGTVATVRDATPAGETQTQMFDGWLVNGGGDVLRAGDTFTVTRPVDMVPHMRDRGVYMVSFVSEGEEFSKGTAYEGIPYVVPSDEPVRETHRFTGWHIDGRDGTVSPGQEIAVSGDTVLTAEWTERAAYTVVYSVDGEEFSRGTAYDGYPYRVIDGTPTDGEMIFDGWRTPSGKVLHAGDEIGVTGGMTLTAEWRERAQYDVVYVTDGGTFLEETAYEGLEYTVTSEVPEDPDCIFVSWKTSGDVSLSPGQRIDVDGPLTLTAEWRDRAEYVVTYVAGDGTFLTGTAYEGVPYEITSDVPVGDRVFTGWRTDASEGLLTAGDEIVVTGPITLTAEWRDRHEYTVTYVSEGSTFATGTAYEGIPYEIIGDVPASDSGIFVSWLLDGSPVSAGDEVTVDGDVTITAEWRDRLVFTVEYVVDGETVIEDTTLEGIPYVVDDLVPESSDGIFVSWKTSGDDEVTAGQEIHLDGDVTLTAVWRDRAEYKVTYMTGDTELFSDAAYEGIPYEITSEVPVGDGMFVGWLLGNDPGALSPGDAIHVDGDVTLTAEWRDRETYDVIYSTGDGMFLEDTATEGIGYSVVTDIPESEDGIFVCWLMDGTELRPGDVLTITEDTVLEAKWRDRMEFAVTYLVDGETALEDTAHEGIPYVIVDLVPEDPDRIFVGWLLEGEELVSGDEIDVSSTTELTAQWRERTEYSVSYVSDGDVVLEDVAYEGVPYLVIDQEPTDPERIFLGWSMNGSGQLTAGGESLELDGDTVLTAMWRDRHEYKVTYVSDDDAFLEEVAVEGIAFVVTDRVPTSGSGVFGGWLLRGHDGLLTAGDSVIVEGDTELVAQWRERSEYSVTYMVDDGEFLSQVAYEGIGYTVAPQVPEDGDRIFVGWLAEGFGLLRDGDVISVTGDTVLTAKWRDRASYDVTYVSEGETLLTETAREGLEFTVSDLVPDNFDGVFDGWYLDGRVLAAGDTVLLDGDAELVAQWRERSEYSVTYLVDGAEFLASVAYEGVPFEIGSDRPDDDDRVFLGWGIDGHDGILRAGDYLSLDGDVVLDAVWRDRSEFVVTYVTEDGTVLTDTATEGVPYCVQRWDPAGPDMVFVGWRADGQGDVLVAGDLVDVDDDLVLVAVWRERAEFTVTYTVNGGTYMVGTALEGIPYEVECWTPTDPDGIFVGWSVTGTGSMLSPGDITVLDGDTAFEAVWRERAEYTVTFAVDGEEFATATAVEGLPFTVIQDTPEKVDGIFDGWLLDGHDGVLLAGDTVAIGGDTTLEATWRDRAEYTVSYVVGEETVLVGTAYEGLPYTVDGLVPTDELLMFTGWSAEGLDGVVGGDVIEPRGDVTLTAQWREKLELTLRYVVDGRTIGSVVHVLESDTVIIDMRVASLWAEFLGWSDGRAVYSVGDGYTVTADTALHAIWGEKDPGCPEGPSDPDGSSETTDPEGPGDPSVPGDPDDPEDPTDPDSPSDASDPDDGPDDPGDPDDGGAGTTDPPTDGTGGNPGTPTEPGDEGPGTTDPPAEDPDDGQSDEPSGPSDPDGTREPTSPGDDDVDGPPSHGDGDAQSFEEDDGIVLPAAIAAAIAAVVVCILLVIARRS